MTQTIDEAMLISPNTISAGGQRLAESFGLGDSTQPSTDWPVDDGDTTIVAELEGALEGQLLLAVNDDVGARLLSDHGRLRDGFVQALTAMLAASDAEIDIEDVTIGGISTADVRPVHSVEIYDGKHMCALFGALAPTVADEPVPGQVDSGAAGMGSGPAVFEPASLAGGGNGAMGTPSAGPLSLLQDVEMDVTVELGRTSMPIRELLSLQPGMVVEIDRQAGAPIDVLVNGRLIACGEVVVIDEEFGIRITEIVDAGARL